MLWLYIVGAVLAAECCRPYSAARCNFLGSVIGAVIGAGASLIGAKKDRKHQNSINAQNRPEAQVAQWRNAGVNPLFGISSGGYIPHRASTIGDDYAVAGSHFARAGELFDRDQFERTELAKENEKLREKLDDLVNPRRPGHIEQYGGLLPLPSQGQYHAQQYRDARNNAGSGSSAAGVGHTGLGESSALDQGDVTVTNPSGTGVTSSFVNPRVADAEMAEARYGDVLQEAHGVMNAVSDTVYQRRLRRVQRKYGEQVALRVHRRFATELDLSLGEIIDQEKPLSATRPKARPVRQERGDRIDRRRGSNALIPTLP